MLSKILSALGLVSLLVLVSCNGTYYTSDVAQNFVNKLNDYYNTYPGEQINLVKRHGHDHYSYIVVYDELTNEYNAYNLDYYTPGMSISSYLNLAGYYDIYYDLAPIGSGFYQGYDGTIFEKTEGTSKDLEKMGAFKEERKVTKQGEELAAQFGLSEERGIQVARLAQQWNTLSKKKSMTSKDANSFSEQMLGLNLTKAVDAYKKSLKGDKKELDDVMKKAAEVNETTPEHMNELMEKFLTE